MPHALGMVQGQHVQNLPLRSALSESRVRRSLMLLSLPLRFERLNDAVSGPKRALQLKTRYCQFSADGWLSASIH